MKATKISSRTSKRKISISWYLPSYLVQIKKSRELACVVLQL
jgi:hypothetical protein